MKVTFREVALIGEKSGKCACGKRRTRRKRFYQTLNPFNRNTTGNPKSGAEIRDELLVEIEDWKRQPITCDACA